MSKCVSGGVFGSNDGGGVLYIFICFFFLFIYHGKIKGIEKSKLHSWGKKSNPVKYK